MTTYRSQVDAASATDFAAVFGVPAEVSAVVREFRSCELSTIARDGTPVAWPTMPSSGSSGAAFSSPHRSDSPRRP